MDTLDKDTLKYLYKCLIRRKRSIAALNLRSEEERVNAAIENFSLYLSEEDICLAREEMRDCKPKDYSIFIDASVRNHDDPSEPNKLSVSFIIYSSDTLLYRYAQYIGEQIELEINGKTHVIDATVNVAEYVALIKALSYIIDNELYGNFHVYSDSMLVVNQVNYTSATRAPHLIVLRNYARSLIEKAGGITLVHLSREENTKADELARFIGDIAHTFKH